MAVEQKPLMPKATAVWLVDNTGLTFEQIADFCGLHPLEVKGIADEDVAKGIKGQDPVATGQLTREQIAEAEKDPRKRLKMAAPKHKMPSVRLKRAPRYTPVSKRQDKPDAVYWLINNHPEFTDSEIIKLIGTTKATIAEDPRALALECRQHQGGGPGDPGPELAAGTGPCRQPRRQPCGTCRQARRQEGRVAEVDCRNHRRASGGCGAGGYTTGDAAGCAGRRRGSARFRRVEDLQRA